MRFRDYLIVYRAPRQVGVNLFFIGLLLFSFPTLGRRQLWITIGLFTILAASHAVQVFAPTAAVWAAILTGWITLEIYIVIVNIHEIELRYIFLLLIPALLVWSKPRPPDYEDEPEINPDTRRHR